MKSWREQENLGVRDLHARGAIVAMAALVEARRAAPSLPSVESIAAKRGTRAALLSASERVHALFGSSLPGIASVWSQAMPDEELAELARKIAGFDWTGVEDPPGRALQECRADEDRKKSGAFYTPSGIVEGLLDAVERGRTLLGATVLDPACGSGAFLIGAARRGARVSGADVDAEAVAVAAFRVRCAGAKDGVFECANLLADRAAAAGPFDAVIGNPPYVRFHNMGVEDRAQLSLAFQTATGQFDLFAPFLEAALARVREGGRVAFVLPALVLRGARYRDLRRFVLDRAHVREVIDHGDGAFEGVLAPTCVLVLERKFARMAARTGGVTVRWSRPAARSGRTETLRVDESRWRGDEAATFAPVAEEAARILERLAGWPRLRDLASLGRGIEIGRRHPALHRDEASGRVGCLTGSDIARHQILSQRWLDLSLLEASQCPDPDDLRARVLVRETGERLTPVRVPDGTASTRSLFDVRPFDPRLHPTDFLAGWLGSALAQWWFATCIRAESGIFPKLRIGQLGTIAVPDSPRLVARLVPLVRRREAARTPELVVRIEAEIDGAIHSALGLSAEEVRVVSAALEPIRTR